jgi:virginiamycin B lyase
MEREPHRWPVRYLLAAAIFAIGWSAGAAAQTIDEFAIPTGASAPEGVALGPDGALWFTENAGNKIGRVSATGAFSEFAIPTAGSGPSGITAGPDGALWFTESNFAGNNIGRITTSGTITEFPVLTADSEPTGITVGPDGALWFTEAEKDKIGRITTAGAVTEFSGLPSVSEPLGITAGPDGALWFTEFHVTADNIGRITTSGTISATKTPTGFSTPNSITSGPDGALWFTEETGNKIGRITTAGVITNEFPIPTTTSQPFGIAVGPDGNLWFTEFNSGGNKIGQITTSGMITEFPVPTASSALEGIAVGPNNSLWFAENAGNKIGTFQTAILTVAESGSGAGQVTSNIPVGSGQINCSATSTSCALTYMTGFPITLTASAAANSVFSGWSGGGCSGTAPCTLTLGSNTTVTATFASTLPSFMLSVAPAGTGSGTVTSNPSGINCGATCSASFLSGTQIALTATAAAGSTFAGWSGGGCSGVTCTVTLTANTTVTPTFVQDTTTNITLVAAILPLSRSVEVGATPTAFATVLNAGPGDASTCTIAPATSIPASFVFQTTNPTTNALTGTPNTPANIAAGAGQSFVIAFTPTAAFAPTNVTFTFGCANANPVATLIGINTLNLSASTTPVPDIVALAASGDPGYVDIPGATGTGVFAVATVNLGVDGTITASANSGTANLPVSFALCQTNPTSGACLASPTSSVTTDIQPNAEPTFGIFVTGSAAVADLPGSNRVFVTFTDSGGVLRGETSVAVRTQ